MLTRIKVDDAAIELVREQGFAMDEVPPKDKMVKLALTGNMSTGGISVDRTFDAHPDNIEIAEEAARMIGLDVAGIDFICPDITEPVREAAARSLRDGETFDADGLARHVRDGLPAYAVPLFVRIVEALEHTSTFKNMRTELRKQAYGQTGDDPLYVLVGEKYVEFYPEFVEELAGRPTR